MKVLDPGHMYEMATLDQTSAHPWNAVLQFVKRDDPPEKYPGNEGHYEGVNIQEVLRVLIDRTQYLQQQAEELKDGDSCSDDELVIGYLRAAFIVLEGRAHRQHGSRLPDYLSERPIETYPSCLTCGHILCSWCE